MKGLKKFSFIAVVLFVACMIIIKYKIEFYDLKTGGNSVSLGSEIIDAVMGETSDLETPTLTKITLPMTILYKVNGTEKEIEAIASYEFVEYRRHFESGDYMTVKITLNYDDISTEGDNDSGFDNLNIILDEPQNLFTDQNEKVNFVFMDIVTTEIHYRKALETGDISYLTNAYENPFIGYS